MATLQITFEQLPPAVAQLCADIAIIKQLLQQKEKAQNKAEIWYHLNWLCD